MYVKYAKNVHNIGKTTFDLEEEHGYVYMVDGKIIGCVKVDLWKTCIAIDTFEVLEKFRRKGWGTKMVKDLFLFYPNGSKISGKSTEKAFDFWKTQENFEYLGEDYEEGTYYFKIDKTLKQTA